jgi:cell division inhibitor SulA
MRQLSMYESYGCNHFDAPDHFTATNFAAHHPKPALVELNTTKNLHVETHEANVTEIILTKDKADCIQLLLPMLTHLNQDQRWLAWVDPPIQLLKQWGQEHDKSATEDIMILRSNDNYSAFELTEKALNAGTCHAVIVWTDKLSNEEFYKLEAASSKGDSHGIILRYR